MRHLNFISLIENNKTENIKAENIIKADEIIKNAINKITNSDILNKIIELNFKVESFNYNIIYFDIFLHISLILFILFSYLFVKYEYYKYKLPYRFSYKNYPESKCQV
jgi:hypothetical protein